MYNKERAGRVLGRAARPRKFLKKRALGPEDGQGDGREELR